MVVNRRLSGPESAKDTRHFELDLTGWGLSFEVGDSLAFMQRTILIWSMKLSMRSAPPAMKKCRGRKANRQHCVKRYCAITASRSQRRGF